MRYCHNENVTVYEASGENLSTLLEETAKVLDGLEDYTFANVVTGPSLDGYGYNVLLYVH